MYQLLQPALSVLTVIYKLKESVASNSPQSVQKRHNFFKQCKLTEKKSNDNFNRLLKQCTSIKHWFCISKV